MSAPRASLVPLVRYDSMDAYLADFAQKLPRDEAPRVSCDFCIHREGTWTYPARDFVMQRMRMPDGSMQDFASQGSWAACDDCSELVERGDADAMVARHLDVGAKDPRAAEALRHIYRSFFEHRLGPRVDSGWLEARCPHPAGALRFQLDDLGSVNPRHHPGLVCSLCGVNLAPHLFEVDEGWHRPMAVRR